MKNLLLTFDLEQFVTPEERDMHINRKALFEISNKGLERIHKVLMETGTKATFFTTLEFAKQSPILKKLAEEGHEIALHGYEHNTGYCDMEEKAAAEELRKAKEGLEKLYKIKVKGFRAPQMKRLKGPVLKEIGIKYDSSYHPTYVPGGYNNFFKTREKHYAYGTRVLPVSVAPYIRAPFSWIWFRNMGLRYVKFCTRLCLKKDDYINLYFHPWDFENINRAPFKGKIPYPFLRNTGEKAARRLKKYIEWCHDKELTGTTISEYLKQ